MYIYKSTHTQVLSHGWGRRTSGLQHICLYLSMCVYIYIYIRIYTYIYIYIHVCRYIHIYIYIYIHIWFLWPGDNHPLIERLAEYGWKPHRDCLVQTNLSLASMYWYMRETQRGTVSSNSRAHTALFQEYSTNLSLRSFSY